MSDDLHRNEFDDDITTSSYSKEFDSSVTSQILSASGYGNLKNIIECNDIDLIRDITNTHTLAQDHFNDEIQIISNAENDNFFLYDPLENKEIEVTNVEVTSNLISLENQSYYSNESTQINSIDNIFSLIRTNDIIQLQKVLRNPVYTKDYENRNLLQIACFEGFYDIAVYLISIGFDVNNNVTNEIGEIIFHDCLRQDVCEKKKLISLLIDNKIDANVKDIDGRTAIHLAALLDFDTLKYFIENNIYNNIYDVDNNGCNILHLACTYGNYIVIKYLLEIKFDININNNKNNLSNLHYVVSKGLDIYSIRLENKSDNKQSLQLFCDMTNLSIVKLLLYNNIDIVVKESDHGQSAFHFASIYDKLDILKYFIDNNIYNDIYDIDNHGNNILHLACMKCNHNIIKYLLSIGYNINKTDKKNQSVLFHSIFSGDLNTVELLLHNGIDINIKSFGGLTALHLTTVCNKLEILKYFIDNNTFMNIYDIDNDGNNILHLACMNSNSNITEYLLSIEYNINKTNQFNQSALHLSIRNGDIITTKLLLKHRIDINIKESDVGHSALHFASFYNKYDILKYLIDNNIYENIYDTDNDGNNILHIACTRSNHDVIKYLLSIGYDINKSNKHDLTAFHFSAGRGDLIATKLLVNHNVNINSKECKYGMSALYFVAYHNQLNILKYFVDNKIYDNINDIDNNGENILHTACSNGSHSIVEYLLSIKFDISKTNECNESALHHSVRYGDLKTIKLLLDHNIDINVKDSNYGQSALHFSSYFNKLEILKYFVNNNIYTDIYDVDNDGDNILHISCSQGNIDIIKYLLSIDYDINKTNKLGQTALHYCVKKGDIAITVLLLNCNVDIYKKESEFGMTAFHFASGFNQLDILKYFIDNNIYNNIYEMTNSGNNIFHLACIKCNHNIIEYLLSIEYDINKSDFNNYSALHYSVQKGDLVTIKLLLNSNIDSNIKSKYGRSALHFTSECNQLDILKYFIDNNVYDNIYDDDNNGYNILHIACMNGNHDIIVFLLSMEYNINKTDYSNHSALHISVRYGNIKAIEILLKYNIDVNIKESKYGLSALHLASACNQLDILKYFIEYNVYDDLYDVDKDGYNILCLACINGNYNIIIYLLSIEYDINRTNKNNSSALHHSVINGDLMITKLLLNHNININIRENYSGQTAFHFASLFNQLDLVKYFIDNNVYNIYDIDNKGNNILHLACEKNNYSIVEYLVSKEFDLNKTNNDNQTGYSISFDKGYNRMCDLLTIKSI